MGYIPDTTYRKRASNINGLVVGNTIVFRTEDNRGRFIIQRIRLVTKTITGTGVLPTINVGWTSTGYTDAINSYVMTQLIVNANELLTLITNVPSAPPSNDIIVRVATAGTLYTAITFDIYIEGFYENN
jgi:hypothetical protein